MGVMINFISSISIGFYRGKSWRLLLCVFDWNEG